MSDSEEKSGFWGTTMNRLKAVLAKTKDQVGAEEAFDHAGQNPTDASSTASPASAPPPVSPDLQNVPQNNSQNAPQPAQTAAAVKSAPAATIRAPRVAKPVDEDFIDTLQDRLIKADLGVGNVGVIIEDLKSESKNKNWTSHDVENFLKREFNKLLADTSGTALTVSTQALNVILVVGVNGVGKTTSIGKLAWRFKQEGKKVLLAAGDTFRAAAESQLEIWSQRAGVDIVRLPDGADPGAVVYQAIGKARDEKYDVVIIDTAGRLHNKTNLMAELKKIRSVVDKQKGDSSVESLLVLDASTGQNGLQQAKVFAETCGLTGVILTKLDGTAKGGVVFAITRELKIPVKLIGIGEKMEDLRDFDADMFVEALF